MFCPTKVPVDKTHKVNVIYKLKCPGYGEEYVGKKDRCLVIRLNEHVTRVEQPMFQHLSGFQAVLLCFAHSVTSNCNRPSKS